MLWTGNLVIGWPSMQPIPSLTAVRPTGLCDQFVSLQEFSPVFFQVSVVCSANPLLNFPLTAEEAGSNCIGGRMNLLWREGRVSFYFRLLALGAGCLGLANCAGGNTSNWVYRNASGIPTTAEHKHHRIVRVTRRTLTHKIRIGLTTAEPKASLYRPKNADRSSVRNLTETTPKQS